MADSPQDTPLRTVEPNRTLLCVRTMPGCPSGCRLHRLLSQTESDVERKLRRVCETAERCEDASERSMMAMTGVYKSKRRVIVNRYMSELRFVELAEGLARNLTSLRKRSSKLSQRLRELRHGVRTQVEDLYRTEVDVDMKLRACHGSCQLVSPFAVDHRGYRALQTEVDQAEETAGRRWRAAPPPEDTPRVRLKPVGVGRPTSAEYKSIPTVQRELLTQFEDIGQNQVILV